MNQTFIRPEPEVVDALAKRYQDAKEALAQKKAEFESIEQEAVAMVTEHGIVPPYAEKSRRLTGKLAELTVTRGDTLTINDERVETLREALDANGHGAFFPKLFTLRSKYEVVEGAESALKSESLPKRLAEKVLNLWGRCISVKAKKPSLKVVLADPAKPAKKAKNGVPTDRSSSVGFQKGGAQ
ncbi:hypothetical protein H7849_11795 [Alloacidobacterium dinghuense]|uniref:Uncharacterized protein n=1 Tax=Alloacidobacterium dinghuense TaxID=2763107 RepID=A0A7G8BPN8_9BACT|nr:hypothetical protein [Alloacidobacterium dinghuense]QNI34508.1 hypothetical protein H7849_11795 [Alloacidobacterium dinghuense]